MKRQRQGPTKPMISKFYFSSRQWAVLLLLPYALLRFKSVQGQEYQEGEVHSWLTGCPDWECFQDYFCTHETGVCVNCPRMGQGATEQDCYDYATNNALSYTGENATLYQDLDLAACLMSCVRPHENQRCSESNACDEGLFFCNYYNEDEDDLGKGDSDVTTVEGDEAATTTPPKEKEGICQPCKTDHTECLSDSTIFNDFGREECLLCDIRTCVPLHYSTVLQEQGDLLELADNGRNNNTLSQQETADANATQNAVAAENQDQNVSTMNTGTTIPSTALQGSPKMAVSGTLRQCTNLIFNGETECDENVNQDGDFICLVEDTTKNTYYIGVVRKCTALGGMGVIFYGDYSPRIANNETWTGSLSYQESDIPSVAVTYDQGKTWESEVVKGESILLSINTTDVGTVCMKRQFCSDDIPCIGYSQGQYCDYKWGGGEGYCRECPPDPLQCFFDVSSDEAAVTGQKAVESCSEVCASSLTFSDCKFCPTDVDGFDFESIDEGPDDEGDDDSNEFDDDKYVTHDEEDRCRFCPENDVQFPDQEFPLFGEGVECFQVQKFFETVYVSKNSRNCQLAYMMNYVCGCEGPGYTGASTQTKRAVLAWLPRAMGIVSFLSSLFIIYDASKTMESRRHVMNQLLICLSIFDCIGSAAYAFTSLPIPEDDPFGPIYGAKGTEGTCTAQGFFIQLGTIASYMNVSLAVYYLLVIKYGWNENRIKRVRIWLFLVPLVVGCAFAFAGIPYYGSLMVWCNNTASWWPDIPVAVAIGFATVVMGAVCWDVYQTDRASAKWRGGAGAAAEAVSRSSMVEGQSTRSSIMSRMRNRMSMKRSSAASNAGVTAGRPSLSGRVFWQAFCYLMAFYLTWPLYLALQYSWASGNSFTRYGFVLTASTMVPLQGFWNMLVYIRPRYLTKALESIRHRIAQTRTNLLGSSWFSSGNNRSQRSSRLQDDDAKASTNKMTFSPEDAGGTASATNESRVERSNRNGTEGRNDDEEAKVEEAREERRYGMDVHNDDDEFHSG